jgi:DNA topoisomerase I
MKHGRFGEFTACSNYPKCKYVKQKTIGVKCPQCGRARSSSGAPSAARPSTAATAIRSATSSPGPSRSEKCPECGSPYLIEKFLKSGHFAQCPNKECKFKRSA